MQFLSSVPRVAALVLGLALAAMPDTASAQSCFNNCGGSAGTCYCDASCVNYGDCCSDYQTYCGSSGPTCATMCNSSSDCGYECPTGSGGTSWCGHYNCYMPEETRDSPCASFCDSTSDCNAQCISETGATATCSSYVCSTMPRPNLDVIPTTTDPCTESGSGTTYAVTCAKNSDTLSLGGSALGMKGWTYYASRVAIDSANAQMGARARFFIVGQEIGSATNPALDVYSHVQPIARDCKGSQSGIYLRAGGSVVWKKTVSKSCIPVTNLTNLPGVSCPDTVLHVDLPTQPQPDPIYDTQIPGASRSFSYTIKVVTATLTASAHAKILYTSGNHLTTRIARGSLSPEVIGYVKGSGGLSLTVFGVGGEVGLRGTANLLDYHIPNTMEVSATNTSHLTSHAFGYYQRKAASWKLEVYLTARFGFLGSKTWAHKIGSGSWGGDGTVNTLFDRYWYPSFGGLTPMSCTQLEADFKATWPSCGDGLCNGSETSCSCPLDCGDSCQIGYCGDGRCSPGESCPMDCGTTCRRLPCPVDPL